MFYRYLFINKEYFHISYSVVNTIWDWNLNNIRKDLHVSLFPATRFVMQLIKAIVSHCLRHETHAEIDNLSHKVWQIQLH